MQSAQPSAPPAPRTTVARHRHLDRLVLLVTLVVALESVWFLGFTPVLLVSEGQADMLLQGDKTLDGERSGMLVPGPPPPHMAHGEGRGDEPVPDMPVPGKPAAPREAHRPTDPYHRLLIGIIRLDEAHAIVRTQARRLLAAIRAREQLNGSDVAEAAKTVLQALTPAQRALIQRQRDARVRQGKPPSAPEELP